MSQTILSRLAGPFAVFSGVLIVGAQLVMLPFDPKDHVATTTAPAFQLGGAAYFVGFVMLMLFLVADHDRLEERTGRLGWMLHGVANLRAHAPVTISVAIIIGGAVGYQALLSPWAVPLGVSVGALGVWLILTNPARTARSATGSGRPEPVIP